MTATLAERIAGLPDAELAALVETVDEGDHDARRAGFPAVADWYATLARLLHAESLWRHGTPVSPPLDAAPALAAAAARLDGRELAAVTIGVMDALYGLPAGPLWDYLAGLLALLKAEHARRHTPSLN